MEKCGILGWKKKTRSNDDVTADEYALIVEREEQAVFEAAEAAIEAAVEREKEAAKLAREKEAKIHAEAERDAMRKVCMLSAEKRRWAWGEEDWTPKRQKSRLVCSQTAGTIELALQAAFEKRR